MNAGTVTPEAPSLVTQIAASFARHFLTLAAGALAANGVIQSNQETEFVSLGLSVVLWGVAQAWSYYQKKNAHAAIVAAQAPVKP